MKAAIEPCSCDEAELYRDALERIRDAISKSTADLKAIAGHALAGTTKGVGQQARVWRPTEPQEPSFPWAGDDPLPSGPRPLREGEKP